MKRKRATLESAPPRDNRMRWENEELSERTVDNTEEDEIGQPLGKPRLSVWSVLGVSIKWSFRVSGNDRIAGCTGSSKELFLFENVLDNRLHSRAIKTNIT